MAEAIENDVLEKWEVVDHGVEHSQYFQGCGTSYTEYDEVVTGIGSNPREAFEDALEELAQHGYSVSDNLALRIIKSWLGERKRTVPTRPSVSRDEVYYHVSIRYNPATRFEVVVGNVGTVYNGPSRAEADSQYNVYCDISRAGTGRVGNEPVTLLQDGEVLREYVLKQPTEDEVMDNVNGRADDPAQHGS